MVGGFKTGVNVTKKILKAPRKALPGGRNRKTIDKIARKLKLAKKLAKNKSRPTSTRSNSADEVGDNSVNPESGFSNQVTDKVGTGGEKVSTGSGSRSMSYIAEQSSKDSRRFRKYVAALQKKVDKKTASPEERKELKRIRAKDVLDTSKARQTAARTRRAGQNKRDDAKFEKEAEEDYINNMGVINQHPRTGKDYEPPIHIQKRAIRNANARASNDKQRSLTAHLESKKTGGQIKNSSRSISRPKGVGASKRGWGKTGKH